MKCAVTYLAWTEIEIPDEVVATGNEEEICQSVYNAIPNCLNVKEVQDENKKAIVENW